MMPWTKADHQINLQIEAQKLVLNHLGLGLQAMQGDMRTLQDAVRDQGKSWAVSDAATIKSRLDEVEQRLARLWSLMTEETKAGRPKLTSYGRVLRGRARVR